MKEGPGRAAIECGHGHPPDGGRVCGCRRHDNQFYSYTDMPLEIHTIANPPGLLQESLGPFRPEVSPRASLKTGGVRESVQRGVAVALRAPGFRVSAKCPESAPGVFGTPFWHSRDTFWTLQSPGPEAVQRHPVGHSLAHPPFSGTLQGHFGPEGPERLLE